MAWAYRPGSRRSDRHLLKPGLWVAIWSLTATCSARGAWRCGMLPCRWKKPGTRGVLRRFSGKYTILSRMRTLRFSSASRDGRSTKLSHWRTRRAVLREVELWPCDYTVNLLPDPFFHTFESNRAGRRRAPNRATGREISSVDRGEKSSCGSSASAGSRAGKCGCSDRPQSRRNTSQT